MKILKNNANNQSDLKEKVNEIKLSCFECNSELSITKEDLSVGEYGAYGFVCPCCGKWSMIDDEDAEKFGYKLQTIDDIKFPLNFRTTLNEEDNVARLDNKEIEKYIKECVEKLRNNKDKDNTIQYAQTGDTFIIVQKFDGDEQYWVLVAKDPYETSMNFSTYDYKLLL